ncbi:hypothetical protein T492DRAFT_1080423 [Pavlovales sp. CCMP2436]|nr:hypothetical protein T492DRAFT_1080423 [Pavlovales sp. CCMP2436]
MDVELAGLLRAVATLAINITDEAAFVLLATSAASIARLTPSGLAATRERAGSVNLSLPQAALSLVRRAKPQLSNCIIRDLGNKRAIYSPERVAFGLGSRDMSALCRLVECIDALQDLALDFEPAAHRRSAAFCMADTLLALALPAARSEAALVLGRDDRLRVRATVLAAAAAASGAALLDAPEPARLTVGQRALRALRDQLPRLHETSMPDAGHGDGGLPVSPGPAAADAAPQPEMHLPLLPPPGFRPLTPMPLQELYEDAPEQRAERKRVREEENVPARKTTAVSKRSAAGAGKRAALGPHTQAASNASARKSTAPAGKVRPPITKGIMAYFASTTPTPGVP